MVAGVFQCIAAGYLLQVAVAQVLPRALAQCAQGPPGPELSHMIWMVVGGFAVAALCSTFAWAALVGVE